MLTRIGGWLFRHRTAIPIPIALVLILVPAYGSSTLLLWLGILIAAAGELLRLSAVRHIGTVSRTRTDRLGPLVASGPFRWVRNPLYIGNIALWIGLALVAQLPWLVAPIALTLAAEYHAIVRWEEQLLASRLGQPYTDYMKTVPRWIPRPPGATVSSGRPSFGWRETLFSERGTLIAIVVGFALLGAKAFFRSSP
jgi:protein-S-isoprenylcysteine O-methyltransferase Ste14